MEGSTPQPTTGAEMSYPRNLIDSHSTAAHKKALADRAAGRPSAYDAAPAPQVSPRFPVQRCKHGTHPDTTCWACEADD